MTKNIDFIDYIFPAIGVILSIRNDRVIMHYKIVRYSIDGPDEIIDMQIAAVSEEVADKVAANVGEVIEKKHLWQELQEAENAALKNT